MELVFLLIFLVFVFLNVIIGLVSSRRKKKRLVTESQREGGSQERGAVVSDTPGELPVQDVVFESSGPVTLELSSEADGRKGSHFEPWERVKSSPEESGDRSRETATPNQREELSAVSPSDGYPSQINRDEAVSFLHEQTANSVPVPRYSLTEVIPTEESPRLSSISETVSILQPGIPSQPSKPLPAISPLEKLETLPLLKRAIVFSEILGSPKGLIEFY